jgi:selenocysteine lyase/cysteine desulfurase
MDSERLHARLQDADIDVALCMGALRASPSVHNDEGDIDKLIDAIP